MSTATVTAAIAAWRARPAIALSPTDDATIRAAIDLMNGVSSAANLANTVAALIAMRERPSTPAADDLVLQQVLAILQ